MMNNLHRSKRPRSNVLLFLHVCLAIAVLAACGSSVEDELLIDAIEQSLEDDTPTSIARFYGDDGFRCTAEAIVQALGGASGAEQNYGVTARTFVGSDLELDLSEAEALRLARATFNCYDYRGLFTAAVSESPLGAELWADEEACVVDALPDSALVRSTAAGFMGEAGASLGAAAAAEIQDALSTAAQRCR